MSTLYVIRHGQASFAADHYDRLSDLGREQALITGLWLERLGLSPDAVYTGTMERQTDTARLALGQITEVAALGSIIDGGFDEYASDGVVKTHLPPLLEERPDLKPMADRMLTDRRSFQIVFEQIMLDWVAGRRNGADCESFAAFQARVQKALFRLMAETGRGRTVFLFTSGGAISMIVQAALGLPDDTAISVNWQVHNASISRFFYTDKKITLSAFNSIGHLEAEGRPELITYR